MEKNYGKRVKDVLRYFGEKGQYVDAQTIADSVNIMNHGSEPIDVRVLENSDEATILSSFVDGEFLVVKEEIVNGNKVKKYMLKDYADKLSNNQSIKLNTNNQQNNSQSTKAIPSNKTNSNSQVTSSQQRKSNRVNSRKKGKGNFKAFFLAALLLIAGYITGISKNELSLNLTSCPSPTLTSCSTDDVTRNNDNTENNYEEVTETKRVVLEEDALSEYETILNSSDENFKKSLGTYIASRENEKHLLDEENTVNDITILGLGIDKDQFDSYSAETRTQLNQMSIDTVHNLIETATNEAYEAYRNLSDEDKAKTDFDLFMRQYLIEVNGVEVSIETLATIEAMYYIQLEAKTLIHAN